MRRADSGDVGRSLWESLVSLWPYVVGYAVALILGAIVILFAVRWAWKDASGGGVRREDQERLSAVLGSIERGLYIAALQLHHAEFIGLWLGIRTAGSWTSWRNGVRKDEDLEGATKDVSGRQVFNIFLMGSALNIAFAVLGERLIHWLTACPRDVSSAVLAFVSACALSAFLLFYVRPRKPSSKL